MRKQCLVMLFLVAFGLLAGLTWTRHLDCSGLCESHYDYIYNEVGNIIPANGGGYLVQGFIRYNSIEEGTFSPRRSVFWKVDEDGNIIWRKTPSGFGKPFSLVSNGVDRYYLLSEGNQGPWSTLTVFDNELNVLDSYYKEYISLFDMHYLDDGLILSGMTSGFQGIAIKTDFQFNTIWQSEAYGYEIFCSIDPYEDGWLCTANHLFVSLSSEGNLLWSCPGSDLEDCVVSSDNRVFLLGYHKIWEMDMTLHSPTVFVEEPPCGFDPFLSRSIVILPNGNIVYNGQADTGEILHCYSPDGQHQWSRSYNLPPGTITFGGGSKRMVVLPDGGLLFPYYIVGNDQTMYLIRTDSNGNVSAAVTSIFAYPNPFKNEIVMEIKGATERNGKLEIYNLKGQKVKTIALDLSGNGEQLASWDGRDTANKQCANGIYFINLLENGKTLSSKKVTLIR